MRFIKLIALICLLAFSYLVGEQQGQKRIHQLLDGGSCQWPKELR